MARFRVSKQDLVKAAKVEQREHPWATPIRAKKIARDHLSMYGPGAYRAEPITERVVSNINKKMGARPIRRKRAPQQTPMARFAGNPFG